MSARHVVGPRTPTKLSRRLAVAVFRAREMCTAPFVAQTEPLGSPVHPFIAGVMSRDRRASPASGGSRPRATPTQSGTRPWEVPAVARVTKKRTTKSSSIAANRRHRRCPATRMPYAVTAPVPGEARPAAVAGDQGGGGWPGSPLRSHCR
ncbi:MAG: hypothetical protein QOG45_508 [Chloroflexota bacterium]|nr:hypothetical protein [Chloroflexota bacterium]